MIKHILSLFFFLMLFQSSFVLAIEVDDTSHEADRKQLRSLLIDIEKGMNENDMPFLLQYLDEDIVITHQNAHVAKGKTEVMEYNDKMTKGPDAPIRKLTTTASIGGPAYFHGNNMAIGYGTAVDDVELSSGQKFKLNVAWTATLIKKEGLWKAAAIHFSTNVLDNAILNKTREMIWWVGGGMLLLGLGIGWFAGKR